MLVLSRTAAQKIFVGDDVVVTVVRIGPHSVRLGIDAPADVRIMREELRDSPQPVDEPATPCVDQEAYRELLASA